MRITTKDVPAQRSPMGDAGSQKASLVIPGLTAGSASAGRGSGRPMKAAQVDAVAAPRGNDKQCLMLGEVTGLQNRYLTAPFPPLSGGIQKRRCHHSVSRPAEPDSVKLSATAFQKVIAANRSAVPDAFQPHRAAVHKRRQVQDRRAAVVDVSRKATSKPLKAPRRRVRSMRSPSSGKKSSPPIAVQDAVTAAGEHERIGARTAASGCPRRRRRRACRDRRRRTACHRGRRRLPARHRRRRRTECRRRCRRPAGRHPTPRRCRRRRRRARRGHRRRRARRRRRRRTGCRRPLARSACRRLRCR